MVTKPDGMFYTCDDEEKAYIHTFMNKGEHDFRLERLTYAPGSLGLPSKQVWFNEELFDYAIIVASEVGSGMNVFSNWLVESEESTWIHLKSLNSANLDPNSSFIIFDRTRGQIQVPEENMDLIAKLAARYDDRPRHANGLSLICLTNETEYALDFDDPLYSRLSDRAHAYRLPRFDLQDLKKWTQELFKKHSLFENHNAHIAHFSKLILEKTAGQPLLTHLLYRLVDDALAELQLPPKLKELEKLAIVKANYIQKHPPKIVTRWKHDLKQLLETNIQARELLRKYVSGAKRTKDLSFSEADILLNIAGWLGSSDPEQAAETWGMASDLHRGWAREVLLDMKKEA